MEFTFNDTRVLCHPTDTVEQLVSQWHADFEAAARAYRESPEYIAAEKKRAEEYAAKCAAPMI